eukprot:TRINITY_DN13559_c0_g1_i1.p1 TRINITY_DN13559_c0_g1~~TRINITY_DN13559_c0_g1_i1.p1  ORF type:complete len:4669 (-),score=764.85 TRINITY_DN13559_c0_g1_i1:3029-17035(-)
MPAKRKKSTEETEKPARGAKRATTAPPTPPAAPAEPEEPESPPHAETSTGAALPRGTLHGVVTQWESTARNPVRRVLLPLRKRPHTIWEDSAFHAEFCHAYIDGAAVGANHQALWVFKGLFDHALKEQKAWLSESGFTTSDVKACERVVHMYQASATVWKKFDNYQRSGNATFMLKYLKEVIKVVRAVSKGDAAIIPTGSFVFLVQRQTDRNYKVVVLNTNPLCDYHLKQADQPKIKQQTCLVVADIPQDRILSEAWWTFTVLHGVNASASATENMYTLLMPWLSNVPIEASATKTVEKELWHTPSSHGNAIWKCLTNACDYMLHSHRVGLAKQKEISFQIRRQMLKWVVNDMHSIRSLSVSGRMLISIACQNIARVATRQSQDGSGRSLRQLELVKEDVDKVEAMMNALPCDDSNFTQPPPMLDLDTGKSQCTQWDAYPLFECLRRIDDVDGMAGAIVPQPRLVPADLLLVPQRVTTFAEALNALNDADVLCTRLSVQWEVIRNTALLKCALLTHLFTQVLPPPAGPKTGQKRACIWASPLTYAQQLATTLLLQRLAEHWVSSCLSLNTKKEFDASRIVVLGGMLCIADAVIRNVATDRPSRITLHFRGYRGAQPYASGLGRFAKQTETISVSSPELLVVRTAVIDYFAELEIPEENIMFTWERTMFSDAASTRFCQDLAYAEAFPMTVPQNYLTGVGDPYYLIVKNCPEFAHYRDVAFFFKYFMCTDLDAFPSGQLNQFQAQLSWAYVPTCGYQVSAFGRVLHCKARGHRWPSYAVATRFTWPNEVHCEDDLLHIKLLPSFNEVLGQRNSELLLSYLTAPYIRIPLVLNFFATEDRVSTLRQQPLRDLLDSVLFEPARILPASLEDKAPKQVPSEDDSLLATSHGLLLNELEHSPQGVVEPLIRLLNLAVESDSGTVRNAPVVEVILYLLRTVARVENYIYFLIAHTTGRHPSISIPLRGVVITPDVLQQLQHSYRELREFIEGSVTDMLESWIGEALQRCLMNADDPLTSARSGWTQSIDESVRLLSRLHAHLLLLYRNVETPEAKTASTLLSSFVFLTTRHTWNQNLLELPETELYEVMQIQRRNLVRWLCAAQPSDLALVMDSIVRVATTTGKRVPSRHDVIHDWSFVDGEGCLGRFTHADRCLPTGSLETSELVSTARSAGISLFNAEIPLTADGEHNVEINLQTLQLTFKTAHLKALDSVIAGDQDVVTVFSHAARGGGLGTMQCATVENAMHREWIRLVGQDHDVQFWKTEDPRLALTDNDREFPDDLADSEQWVYQVFEPVRRQRYARPPWQPPILFFLPDQTLNADATCCFIVAVDPDTGALMHEIYAFRYPQCVQIYEVVSYGRRFYRSLFYTTDARLCLQDMQPPFGDRNAPWAKWARHEAETNSIKTTTSAIILRHANASGNASGTEEQFIPARFLRGLVPSALLDTHLFWQDDEDNLRGYPLSEQDGEPQSHHIIFVQLKDVATMDCLCIPGTMARIVRYSRKAHAPTARARLRTPEPHDEPGTPLVTSPSAEPFTSDAEVLPLVRTSSTASGLGDSTPLCRTVSLAEAPTGSKSSEEHDMLMLNLLYAKEGTPLYSLGRLLSRIENLSYVLAWTRNLAGDTDGGDFFVDLVQLPRLKLSFAARVGNDGTTRLYSLDHAHLFVCNERGPLTTQLLQGIPHSLLLCDQNKEISILVPSVRVVRPSIQSNPFSTEVVLNRQDSTWWGPLETRYYLYPLHVSLSFMFTPTLASALYLLYLRYLHRDYQEVYRLIATIGTDMPFSTEERLIFGAIGGVHDPHPNSHACRVKIGLLTADSPIAVAWYLPSETAQLLSKMSYVAVACQLPQADEVRLHRICELLQRKMDIIRKYAGRDPMAWQGVVSQMHNPALAALEHTSGSRKQVRDILAGIIADMRTQLDVRVSRDDLWRLIQLFVSHAQAPLPQYYQCLLQNRKSFLEAEAASEATYAVCVPTYGNDSSHAFHRDESIVSMRDPSSLGITLSYNRFATLTGFQLLNTLQQVVTSYYSYTPPAVHPQPQFGAFAAADPRITVNHAQGFLFLYELWTGYTRCKISTAGCGKDVASLVVHFLADGHAFGPLQSILHIAAHNYSLALPKWEPPNIGNTKRARFQNSFATHPDVKGASYLTQFLQKVQKVVKGADIDWPANPFDFAAHKASVLRDVRTQYRPVKRSSVSQPLTETLIVAQLTNFNCQERTLSLTNFAALEPFGGAGAAKLSLDASDLKCFAGRPLDALNLDQFIEFTDRRDRGLPLIDERLPFDLSSHPSSFASVAKAMLSRLSTDMQEFAHLSNTRRTPTLKGMRPHDMRTAVAADKSNKTRQIGKMLGDLKLLHLKLTRLRDTDSDYVGKAIPIIHGCANYVDIKSGSSKEKISRLTYLLRRYSGRETEMWLDYLFGSLLSSNAVFDWQKLNPFLPDEATGPLFELIASCVLKANRVGHANKCREEISGLIDLLQTAMGLDCSGDPSKAEALTAAIQQKADSTATLLAAPRCYMQARDSAVSFDPRFAMFEYVWNILLRQQQVDIVQGFVKTLRDGNSNVRQMIMGAGKTTVVGPLLTLMLADGETLLMQVVPQSLLDFTRGVLRSTFSCIMHKQIYTFLCDRVAEVDAELYAKFLHARQSRGVVVTTPSALKSIWLKCVEGLDHIEDSTRPRSSDSEKDVQELTRILSLWRDSVLIMDEVDLILHPLKSELNFPIGAKLEIDFSPLRWKLPIHLLDAIYFNQLGRMSVPFKESIRAVEILARVKTVMQEGLSCNALQHTPHVILLNVDFFHHRLRPLLAEWLVLWVRAQHLLPLSDEQVIEYMLTRASGNEALVQAVETSLTPHFKKMLNLSFDWLNSYLPHVLQKVDRVTYGIMTDDEFKRAIEEVPNMPRSRQKLAIPFIGKDLPSQSSEFAHPDVVIGLTILAYRYEGLRETDFRDILSSIQEAVEKEPGRYSQRKTNIMFERWVKAAGGRVMKRYQYRLAAEAKAADTPVDGDTSMHDAGEPEIIEVVPLRMLKQSNECEVTKLWKLLRKVPEAIHWYVMEIIFPEFMRHQKTKLSASGQELGGDMLFGRRVGFSGTPSDLLPEELGHCDYERTTDGLMVHTLTSPDVMSFSVLEPAWSVKSILNRIAMASPPFHALIDTGALITGMNNLQVAQYLLKVGLPTMEGVVFLDELDRKMILVRATGRVMKLAECGIPKHRRFAFYDQVHTTGMDITHTPNAQAVLTLGKDMCFRDYSQGAFRMRGINSGQTIHLLIIPEVYDLINRELVALRPKVVLPSVHDRPVKDVLVDVVAWLLVNSMRSERVQFNQLCVQTVSNVWRKCAFNQLHKSIDKFKVVGDVPQKLKKALQLFREPVEFKIEDIVPKTRMFSETIGNMVEAHREFIVGAGPLSVIDKIQSLVHREDETDRPEFDVQMVQEQEEEKEEEQEKEQEREIEMERFIDMAYSRDEEAPVPWAFETLRSTETASQFYPLHKFHLYKRRALSFPEYLMASTNYFNPRWSGHRRIKNVIVSMEWVPSVEQLNVLPRPTRDYAEINPEAVSSGLERMLRLLDPTSSGTVACHQDLLEGLVTIALDMVPTKDDIQELVRFLQPDEQLRVAYRKYLEFLQSNILRSEQSGRYTVALALCEAETIRRILHVRRESPVLGDSSTGLALRCVPSNNVLLDRSYSFPAAPRTYQVEKALQCLRFFDCDLHYAEPELGLLLRSIHGNPAKQRQVFFQQIMACRRRTRQQWEQAPIAKAFKLLNAFTLLHQRAVGLTMRRAVEAKGMHLGDAFLAFNHSRTGVLSPGEVWGALEWLGISVSAEDVLDFVDTADSTGQGTIAYPDFLCILTGTRDIKEDAMETDEWDAGKLLPDVPPRGAEQLATLKATREQTARRQEEEALKEQEEEDRQAAIEIEAQEDKEAAETGEANPAVVDAALRFNLQREQLPRFVTGFGSVRNAVDKQGDLKPFWEIREESYLEMNLKSLPTAEKKVQAWSFTADVKCPKGHKFPTAGLALLRTGDLGASPAIHCAFLLTAEGSIRCVTSSAKQANALQGSPVAVAVPFGLQSAPAFAFGGGFGGGFGTGFGTQAFGFGTPAAAATPIFGSTSRPDQGGMPLTYGDDEEEEARDSDEEGETLEELVLDDPDLDDFDLDDLEEKLEKEQEEEKKKSRTRARKKAESEDEDEDEQEEKEEEEEEEREEDSDDPEVDGEEPEDPDAPLQPYKKRKRIVVRDEDAEEEKEVKKSRGQIRFDDGQWHVITITVNVDVEEIEQSRPADDEEPVAPEPKKRGRGKAAAAPTPRMLVEKVKVERVRVTALVDGYGVAVEEMPANIEAATIHVEPGIQLFGSGDTLSMLGGCVKWVEVNQHFPVEHFTKVHRQYLQSCDWKCTSCAGENSRNLFKCDYCGCSRHGKKPVHAQKKSSKATEELSREEIAAQRAIPGRRTAFNPALPKSAAAKKLISRHQRIAQSRVKAKPGTKKTKQISHGFGADPETQARIRRRDELMQKINAYQQKVTQHFQAQQSPLQLEIQKVQAEMNTLNSTPGAMATSSGQSRYRQLEDMSASLQTRLQRLNYQHQLANIPVQEKNTLLQLLYRDTYGWRGSTAMNVIRSYRQQLMSYRLQRHNCIYQMKGQPLTEQINAISRRVSRTTGEEQQKLSQKLQELQQRNSQLWEEHNRLQQQLQLQMQQVRKR